METLGDQEKIELVKQLIRHKRDIDQFTDKFDELFGVMNGFVGSSEGYYKVFNRLLSDYIALVAIKIGDSEEGISWFIYENDCGVKGNECGYKNKNFIIDSAESYIDWLNWCAEPQDL